MLSATRSRWGQRLGQKKAAGENNNLCKQKDPKPSVFVDKAVNQIITAAESAMGEKLSCKATD